MANIYIKQPRSKKYAIYSTAIENFVELNLTWKELTKYHGSNAGSLTQIVRDDNLNYKFDELLSVVSDKHGKREANRIQSEIEK